MLRSSLTCKQVVLVSAFIVLLALPVWGQTRFVGSLTSYQPDVFCSSNYPCAMAADAAGNLYVGQQWPVSRIFVYYANGTEDILANLPGRPTGIAVDQSGNVFVLDWDNDQVLRTKPDKTQTVIATGISQAYAIATDLAGNVYFGSQASGSYVEMAPAGTNTSCQYATWSGSCAKVGNLRETWALAVDSTGGVYSAETGGLYYLPFGGNEATRVDDHWFERGLTVDAAGHVWGADQGSNVTELIPWSDVVEAVDMPIGATEIDAGLTADSAGNIYVLDSGSDQLFTLLGHLGQFGSTYVGTGWSSTATLIFMPNTLLGSIGAVTQGTSVGSDFSVTGGTCDTVTDYGMWDICTVQVTFAPTAPGTRAGSLRLRDYDSTPVANIPLTGVGKSAILAFTPGTISTVAGNGSECPDLNTNCGDGGTATSAMLASPYGIAMDSAGNIYITDTDLNRIRKVDTKGNISTIAGTGVACADATSSCGDGGPATGAQLNEPFDLALDGNGNLYIADLGNFRIRKVDATTGIITTTAGTGVEGNRGNGGPAVNANLGLVPAIAVDGAGNLYLSDMGSTVRRVDAVTGIISGIVGEVEVPTGVAVDPAGNVYVSNYNQDTVEKWAAADGSTTVVAGDGAECPLSVSPCGDGGPATDAQLYHPRGLAVDAAGNLYIVDRDDHRVRMVNAASGIITTVAGDGGFCANPNEPCGDGGAATSAQLRSAYRVVVDPTGNLYIADTTNQRIRKVDVSTPPVLTFPSTVVGQTSATQAVVVENLGNYSTHLSYNLTNAALDETLGGSCFGDFEPFLAPGKLCAIGIKFAPLVAGDPLFGSVVLTDNVPNSPQTIQISGPATGGSSGSTKTTVAADVNPAVYGASVTFTVTVTAVAPATGTPTGTVTVADAGNSTIGTLTLVKGQATVTTASLGLGNHSILATYSGDTNFTGSTSSNLKETVDYGVSLGSVSSAVYGSSVTFTATVTPSDAGGGFVYLFDGGVQFATIPESPAGAYSFSTTALEAGSHSITAGYYNPNAVVGGSSAAVTLTVTKAPLMVTADNKSTVYGQAIPSLTATMAGYVNGDTASAVSGSANCTTRATSTSAVGIYPITCAQGSLTSAEYSFAFTGATLTVTPATLTVKALNQMMMEGGAMPNLSAQTLGVVSGDAVTGAAACTTTATSWSPAGSYPITCSMGSLAASSNYVFGSIVNGTLTISAWTPPMSGSLTIAYLDPVVIQAGSQAFTLHISGSGFVSGSTVLWNGSSRVTTFVNATTLTAAITAADVSTTQKVPIVIKNPDGGTSQSFWLAVDSAATQGAPPTVSASNINLQVSQGGGTSLKVSFSNLPSNMQAGLTCMNLPTGVTCSYDSSSKTITITTTPGTPKGTYQFVVVFALTQTRAALRHSGVLWAALGGGLGLPFGLLWVGWPDMKRRQRALLLLIGLLLMLALCGCGGSETTQAVPVTAEAQASMSLNVSVQ